MGIYIGKAPAAVDRPTAHDSTDAAVDAKTGEPIWLPADELYEVFWHRWGMWQEAQRRKADAMRNALVLPRKGPAEMESEARADVGVDLSHRCACCSCEMFSLDMFCFTCAKTDLAPTGKQAWWLRLLRWVTR